MERTTIYTTDVGHIIEELSARVMELIEYDRKSEVQRRKAETEVKYLTRREAAEKLHISLSALHHRINKGDIPAYRIGGRTLLKDDEINQSLIKKNS